MPFLLQLAEPDLLQLKSMAPLEPTVHYLLGKLYKSLGPSKRSQMLAAFTTAQDLEPRMASCVLHPPLLQVRFVC